MEFTSDELSRYARHFTLPQIGTEGQMALRGASVTVVGLGGLGSASATYLTAAGVGRLTLIDSDVVELSNLQRQVLYTTNDVGRSKVDCAEARLKALNPNVVVRTRFERVRPEIARSLIEDCDIVVDGTDNLAARYCLNEACAAHETPLAYAAVRHWGGQISLFDARKGPCYRCLYPDPLAPEELAQNAADGILGALPGVMGAMQAAECVRLIAGAGEPLIGRLLLIDMLAMKMREVAIPRDPLCPVCGGGR